MSRRKRSGSSVLADKKDSPDLSNLLTIGVIIYFASGIVGVPLMNFYSRVNPWFIVDSPALVSFLLFSAITIWVRRRFFNLKF
ncbi:hypothetical protein [Teredinibacter turnerae]|uniref:hypothetical protein n=1 Tax=Teredinibacter turnerae TaxID=2426 RepID=UPI00037325ED|nr:hypothetical protein [Teredinibacter turnerae]